MADSSSPSPIPPWRSPAIRHGAARGGAALRDHLYSPGAAGRDAGGRGGRAHARARSGIYDVRVHAAATARRWRSSAAIRAPPAEQVPEIRGGVRWRLTLPGRLDRDRNRLARRDRRAATRAARLDAAPRLRQRAALPRGVRRGRRASRRFPRARRSARNFRSPPSRICAPTIRSACSRCRASRSCAIHASSGTTGKPTVVGYTREDLEIWAHRSWRARSTPPAGGRG